MDYLVRHRTTYRYLQDVSHSWHLAHLRPRVTPLQAVHDSSITLSLEPASRVERARILLAYREDPSFFAVGQARSDCITKPSNVVWSGRRLKARRA